jgi:CBS domain-containing protein
MQSRRIHHLVVTSAGSVVGVVSSADLGGEAGTNLRVGRHVNDLMTASLLTATPESTVREAANFLRGRSIGCLPVLEGGKLVGIVTISDLLTLLGKGVERPMSRGVRPILRKRGEHPRPSVRSGRGR